MKFLLRWTEKSGTENRSSMEECVYLPIPGDLYTPKDGPQLRVMSRRLGADALPVLDGIVSREDESDE